MCRAGWRSSDALAGRLARIAPPGSLAQIIAMRNVMIHGYDVVLSEVLWDVATSDIPKLRGEINALLEAGGSSG
jgi:uncharacterized protein with HEPN domain